MLEWNLSGTNSKSLSRYDAWAILALVLIAGIFFREILLYQTHTHMGGWDASIQSFAWSAHIATALQEGSFPFWDMHSEAGEYFIGEMQTGAFYPPNWLFALVYEPGELESLQYWSDFYLVAHLMMCSLFSYLFLREAGFSAVASLAGAIVASYFGAIAERISGQPNIYAGMIFLPAVLFWMLKAWNSKRPRADLLYAGLGGLFLSCCILSGHLYSYIHTAFITALLLFFICLKEKQGWSRAVKLLALLGFSSLLLASPQLDASFEYFRRAYKWYGEGFTAYPHRVPFSVFSDWQFSCWNTLLSWRGAEGCSESRTLYLGLTAWPLAIIGFVVSATARKVILPVLVIVIVIAVAGDNLMGRVLYHLPVINKVRIPSRILFVVPVLVAVLVCTGIDFLRSRNMKPGLGFALMMLVAAGLIADLSSQNLNPSVKGTLKTYPRLYNPPTYYGDPAGVWLQQALGENSLYRWSSEPKELLPPNLGQVNGTNSIRGHRSSMQASFYHHQGSPSDPGGWNRRLGKKYLVSEQEYPDLNAVFTNGSKIIYEMPDPLPLVHAVNGDTFTELPISSVNWSTNSLQIQLAPGFEPTAGERIFFGLSWFPGWRLQVNGEKRELRHGVPEDGAFMSADLQAGDSAITLEFRSRRYLLYWLFPFLYMVLIGLLFRQYTKGRSI